MAKKKSGEESFKVIAPFRDKDNFSVAYEIGQDVSDLSEDRLLELIEKGLVSNADEPED
jgi:hypothetical protein